MDDAQNDTEGEEGLLQEAELSLEERRARLPRQLAGMQLVLELPRRLIERDDVVSAAGDCNGRDQLATRVIAAALLLCWPSTHRRNGVPRYRGDIFDFGGEAYDFLLSHGASRPDILRAGSVAMEMCTTALLAQQASMAEARGNSEAPRGGGSGNSTGSSSGSGLPSVVLASSGPK